jgi:hypothetical protein
MKSALAGPLRAPARQHRANDARVALFGLRAEGRGDTAAKSGMPERSIGRWQYDQRPSGLKWLRIKSSSPGRSNPMTIIKFV